MTNLAQPLFVATSTDVSAKLDENEYTYNPPVNLTHCTFIAKGITEAPSGEYHVISFVGTDAAWTFNTEAERDQELANLLQRINAIILDE